MLITLENQKKEYYSSLDYLSKPYVRYEKDGIKIEFFINLLSYIKFYDFYDYLTEKDDVDDLLSFDLNYIFRLGIEGERLKISNKKFERMNEEIFKITFECPYPKKTLNNILLSLEINLDEPITFWVRNKVLGEYKRFPEKYMKIFVKECEEGNSEENILALKYRLEELFPQKFIRVSNIFETRSTLYPKFEYIENIEQKSLNQILEYAGNFVVQRDIEIQKSGPLCDYTFSSKILEDNPEKQITIITDSATLLTDLVSFDKTLSNNTTYDAVCLEKENIKDQNQLPEANFTGTIFINVLQMFSSGMITREQAEIFIKNTEEDAKKILLTRNKQNLDFIKNKNGRFLPNLQIIDKPTKSEIFYTTTLLTDILKIPVVGEYYQIYEK